MSHEHFSSPYPDSPRYLAAISAGTRMGHWGRWDRVGRLGRLGRLGIWNADLRAWHLAALLAMEVVAQVNLTQSPGVDPLVPEV